MVTGHPDYEKGSTIWWNYTAGLGCKWWQRRVDGTRVEGLILDEQKNEGS